MTGQDANRLAWSVQRSTGQTHVTMTGEVDENSDFRQLLEQLSGDTVFELRAVSRINSCGVREWVTFFRDLGRKVKSVTFVGCSPAIVTQLGMIHNFRGPARIASFMAPYACEKCNFEEEKLLSVQEHFSGASRNLPEFKCGRCGQPMIFDDMPDRYLSFLDDTGEEAASVS
jgi:anti-anti-sigma regulatory factor